MDLPGYIPCYGILWLSVYKGITCEIVNMYMNSTDSKSKQFMQRKMQSWVLMVRSGSAKKVER